LENIDGYQFYSSFGEDGSPFQEWLGDGIVELPSLTILTEIIFLRKDRKEHRSTNILGNNHFYYLAIGIT
jgi:hypothetical protein